MKKRQTNFELLRIVAMCMIIAMHYLTKGMNIPKLSEDIGPANCIYRLIYAFCAVAVNVYVLITGYFSVDAEWKIRKVIRLWGTVFTYSIGVPLVLYLIGIVNLNGMGLGVWQQLILPVEYEHYWFATAYILMYLISPVLSIATSNLDRKQLQKVIVCMLAVFSGLKSINPYLIPWDRYGCDFIWFVCLYLISGYIRKYGLKIINTRKKSLLIYICGSMATFLAAIISAIIVRNTGKFEYYMDMTYAYNYVTVVLASIGLFGVFINMNPLANDSKAAKIICELASYTFGIYLLHENVLLREAWPKWLGIEKVSGVPFHIMHMLICIIVIFAIGSVIEAIRKLVVWKIESFFLKRNTKA